MRIRAPLQVLPASSVSGTDRYHVVLKHGGGRALVVNAVDAGTADFWRRRGFLPSKDDRLVLFRSIPDIAASIEKGREVIGLVPLGAARSPQP